MVYKKKGAATISIYATVVGELDVYSTHVNLSDNAQPPSKDFLVHSSPIEGNTRLYAVKNAFASTRNYENQHLDVDSLFHDHNALLVLV